jgi:translation initiation factor IF-3
MARERGLDLVEISPNAVPPVCRIQDYGKFLYEKDKSDRAARKKQKVIVIKEVKFSVTVDEHDYQTKKNMAVRFLGEGDKVKASLRFKGRQMAHRDLGYKIINRLIQDIGDNGWSSSCRAWKARRCTRFLLRPSEGEASGVRKPAGKRPVSSRARVGSLSVVKAFSASGRSCRASWLVRMRRQLPGMILLLPCLRLRTCLCPERLPPPSRARIYRARSRSSWRVSVKA